LAKVSAFLMIKDCKNWDLYAIDLDAIKALAKRQIELCAKKPIQPRGPTKPSNRACSSLDTIAESAEPLEQNQEGQESPLTSFDWDYFLEDPDAIMMKQQLGLTTPISSPVLVSHIEEERKIKDHGNQWLIKFKKSCIHSSNPSKHLTTSYIFS
jgi:hypothetical protein